ncbi:hypothetical protein [Escherichia coli]|uniref:hypothetical protein n=1 Tax=Escherichia coli TaxID=562 RepID=UPI00201CB9C8|nr:hypothetical protein [Escherichia coli]
MLFINTISDAVHSCTCHDVPGRALNRLVINRTSTSATDKMCGGRFIPFTGRIVHFIASNPHTGLALASVPIRFVENAGKGDIEIVKVTASKFRWPGATATCPMGKKVIGVVQNAALELALSGLSVQYL